MLPSDSQPTPTAEEAHTLTAQTPAPAPSPSGFRFVEAPHGPQEPAGRLAGAKPFDRARNSLRRRVRHAEVRRILTAKGKLRPGLGRVAVATHSAHLGCFRAGLARKTLDLIETRLGVAEALADVARVESVVTWLQAQEGREDDAARQAACVEGVFPWEAWCPACNRREWRVRGECGHRACSLCHRRYYAKLARSIRRRLGSMKWMGYMTWTIPTNIARIHAPDQFTKWAKRLAKAICDWFHPIIPAGAIYLHTSGESDPWKAHPHYNVVWSQWGWNTATGEVVKIPGPFLPLDEILEMRNWCALQAFNLAPHRVQGHYNYAKSEKTIRHKLRYVFRSQGDGNDLARHAYTLSRARMCRPFGMIATGKAKEWKALRGWATPESEEAELGVEGVRGETCRACFEPVRDLAGTP